MKFHSLFCTTIGAALVALISSPLLATIILVPSQYPTIQQGLNAAATGDTVLVAPGTYPENISWPNVDGILLTSEYGPDSTAIDGGSAQRVIDFPSVAFSTATEITGFCIQNGYAVQGAGIYIYQGSPYIHGNVIRWNVAEGTSTWVYGGGIFCDGVGRPRIEYNLIQGNAAKGQYWNYGGGIYIDSNNSALILGNTIEHDTTVGGSWNYGAGIYCRTGSTPDIMHNIIRENICTQGSRGHGGGIYTGTGCNAYILSNLICENRTQSGSWNYGAGVLINSDAHVINNTITENVCTGGNWNYGGGIRIYDSTNTIENNIIVNNSASSGGGIYAGTGDHALLLYNDVWNNSGGNYSGINPGANDISTDPLFVSGPLGDYYLSQIAAGQGQDSPCLDYGSTTAESLGLDTYTTRTDTIPDSNMVDLGYHYPTANPTGIEGSDGLPAQIKIAIVPSPVHSSCHIELFLEHAERISLRIYDAAGRLQYNVHEGYLDPGIHSWNWTGRDRRGSRLPAGSYFLIVCVKDERPRTEKILFVR